MWPRPVLLWCTLVMMARASLELISCTPSGVGLRIRMLVRRSSHRIRSGWSADFRSSTL